MDQLELVRAVDASIQTQVQKCGSSSLQVLAVARLLDLLISALDAADTETAVVSVTATATQTSASPMNVQGIT